MRFTSKTIAALPGLAAALLLSAAASTPAAAPEAAWEKLRAGGYTVLIRHATTVPGLGDPPGFKLVNCSTQRNLSDAGRGEARRIGERFRKENVAVAAGRGVCGARSAGRENRARRPHPAALSARPTSPRSPAAAG